MSRTGAGAGSNFPNYCKGETYPINADHGCPINYGKRGTKKRVAGSQKNQSLSEEKKAV